MEWWKLFSGTFILIFLAELGDKTQLAAMAKTADAPGGGAKWVVFLGASLALVASTFIAVFLGHYLKALVPDERYIKIAAGALFLVFGFMILRETYASFRGEKEAAPAAVAPLAEPGLVGGLAMAAAMDFEHAVGDRYRRLAHSAPPELARLLTALACEEDGHLARLRGLAEPAESCPAAPPAGEAEGWAMERVAAAANGSDTLADLIRHEEATAEFYQSLAKRALIPSVRSVFGTLAEEERNHARRLAGIAESMKERV